MGRRSLLFLLDHPPWRLFPRGQMAGVPFRLFGWRTVEVAGHRIAQAVFVETRTGGEKPLTAEERNFVRQAREAGAFVGSAIRIQGRAVVAEIEEE